MVLNEIIHVDLEQGLASSKHSRMKVTFFEQVIEKKLQLI